MFFLSMSALALGAICAAFVGSSTENYREGEFLGRECPGDISRDGITLKAVNDAATAWKTGTVLGAITIGAITPSAGGGNTGTGTLATVTAGAKTKVGVYTLTCDSVTGGYWFNMIDPNGRSLGQVKATGAPQTNSDFTFTLTDNGGGHFVIGDSFTITVAAATLDANGNPKYKILAPAATDGSQNAAGVLYSTAYVGGANDVQGTIINFGATVAAGLINWPAGITDPQKAAAIAQLFTLGIKFRPNI